MFHASLPHISRYSSGVWFYPALKMPQKCGMGIKSAERGYFQNRPVPRPQKGAGVRDTNLGQELFERIPKHLFKNLFHRIRLHTELLTQIQEGDILGK